ncbi:PTS sugar transporter subunit IIA [Companilactobacillus jidongensis]|uniref:PTS sugar transporter subunit IIA n=1 Tax=Companilactobacillus jidongensis TaxID=2486006 RepID=UPI000F768F31|nr:PTS sugar transporter subunit IIA [Companilactobacillus jidongensis]
MREKNKIILLTHGGWGNSLISSMGMLVGKTENVFDIALEPSMTLEQYIERIQEESNPVDENTLVLTDIPGGTTSNVALRLTRKYPWKIISGVNSLMLIEAIMHQDENISDELVNKILDAGNQSQKILKIPVSVKNKEES